MGPVKASLTAWVKSAEQMNFLGSRRAICWKCVASVCLATQTTGGAAAPSLLRALRVFVLRIAVLTKAPLPTRESPFGSGRHEPRLRDCHHEVSQRPRPHPQGRKWRFSAAFRIPGSIFTIDPKSTKQSLVNQRRRWMPLCLGLMPASQQITLQERFSLARIGADPTRIHHDYGHRRDRRLTIAATKQPAEKSRIPKRPGLRDNALPVPQSSAQNRGRGPRLDLSVHEQRCRAQPIANRP